jgi:hypothetical protein
MYNGSGKRVAVVDICVYLIQNYVTHFERVI